MGTKQSKALRGGGLGNPRKAVDELVFVRQIEKEEEDKKIKTINQLVSFLENDKYKEKLKDNIIANITTKIEKYIKKYKEVCADQVYLLFELASRGGGKKEEGHVIPPPDVEKEFPGIRDNFNSMRAIKALIEPYVAVGESLQEQGIRQELEKKERCDIFRDETLFRKIVHELARTTDASLFNAQLEDTQKLSNAITEKIEKLKSLLTTEFSTEQKCNGHFSDEENDVQSDLFAADGALKIGVNSRKNIEIMVIDIVNTMATNPGAIQNGHLNVIIMGSAGAGKTRIATILANVMKYCGLLMSPKDVDIVSKPDLVAQYVGQSAPKTKSRLMENIENVIFIDEAYTITQKDDSYAAEVIGELINFQDKHEGQICVMAAGYETKMRNEFLQSNEGMPRRFPFQLVLKPFSPVELASIFCGFMAIKNIKGNYLTKKAAVILVNNFTDNATVLYKNSAGDVQNLAGIASRYYNEKNSPEEPGANPTTNPLTGQDMERIIIQFCRSKNLNCAEETEDEKNKAKTGGGGDSSNKNEMLKKILGAAAVGGTGYLIGRNQSRRRKK